MEEKIRIAIVRKYLEDTSRPYCEIAKSPKKSRSTVRKVILWYLDNSEDGMARGLAWHRWHVPFSNRKMARAISFQFAPLN